MEGKVVYEGSIRDGRRLVVRYPEKNDLDILTTYINTLSQEQTFLRVQGEEISREQEYIYLTNQLERIIRNQTVQLLAFCDDVLIGNTDINLQTQIESHIGVFGISLAKNFRGLGIGTLLMQLIFQEATLKLSGIKMIRLSVYAHNEIAIAMYKKCGFQEYGRLPDGIFYKGEYIDHVYMYKYIDLPR